MFLKDRVAIVTGGARGIGKAICEALYEQGATVVVSDIMLDLAQETAKALGPKAMAIETNVANEDSVNKGIKEVMDSLGHIDILVNNAGVARDKLLMRMTSEDWDLVLNVNLKGAFLCTKAVVPILLRAKGGRIINITSVIGLMGNAGQANYAASKGGLISFSKSTAKEVASRNITVNCVAPGYIATEMTDKLPEQVKIEYLKSIPLARPGTPKDVANVVCWLASDAASYITGQVIQVDGGMLM